MEKFTDKKEEVRMRIIECAMLLFQEKGIKQVRMDDVAAKLSISKKTIYENFSDKEQLLLEVVRYASSNECESGFRVRCESENVLEQLFDFFVQLIDYCKHVNPLYFEESSRYPKVVAHYQQMRDKHLTAVHEWLNLGIAQGLLRDDINFDLFLSNEGFQVVRMLRNPDIRLYSVKEVCQSIVLVTLRGISTAKGLEVIEKLKY